MSKNLSIGAKLLSFKNKFIARFQKLSGVFVGSVAGTFLLGLQTLILYQQTILMGKQTLALSLDQSAHIRDRIVASAGVESSVKRLLLSLASVKTINIDDPNGGPLITVRDYVINACLNDKCSQAPLDTIFKQISNDTPLVDQDVSAGAMRLGVYLQRVEQSVSSAVEAPQAIDLNKTKDQLSSQRELFTSAITQCFFDPEKARGLSDKMATLRLISSNASSIQFRLGDPAFFRDMTTKFPQTNSNTKMGIFEMSDNAANLVDSERQANPTADTERGKYTFATFLAALTHAYQEVFVGLNNLDDQCQTTLKNDANALKAMATGLER